jgi:hypothetical protein
MVHLETFQLADSPFLFPKLGLTGARKTPLQLVTLKLKPVRETIDVSAALDTKLLTPRKLTTCDKHNDKTRGIPSVICSFFTDHFRSFSRSLNIMISAKVLLAFGLVAVSAGPCKPVTTSCKSIASAREVN